MMSWTCRKRVAFPPPRSRIKSKSSPFASTLIYHRPATGEIVVVHKVQDPFCNLPAARNTRLNLVGVVLCFRANQPKVQYRKPMRNCLPQNAIVEDVQGSRGQSLHEGIRETGVINGAEGERQFTRKHGSQHPVVVLMEFGPECCQLVNRATN